ncbi:hypothetical protein J5N97_002833 [Dioscorea zingiberensis]|uniref:Uncharacterized protein n=1 Tax=Dioscorea zingiberensis TaxID=325984 RepID=A0A9D5D529_9LILI|nr:hypothetical protein J5N97_002833 [Dioscorea zingiberensis]
MLIWRQQLFHVSSGSLFPIADTHGILLMHKKSSNEIISQTLEFLCQTPVSFRQLLRTVLALTSASITISSIAHIFIMLVCFLVTIMLARQSTFAKIAKIN